MDYMKHKYSKRVYQVMTDHGPDHPYLSCFPFVRYVSKGAMEKFFSPCGKPQVATEPLVSVTQEIEWEKRQLRKEEPIVVKAPTPISRPKAKRERVHRERTGPEEYTLKDLCSELGIPPATARKLLRSKGKAAPDGGWKWPDKEAAKPTKKFLKKLL